MLKLQFHPARLVAIDGGEWIALPRAEFQLLRILKCCADELMPFRRIHRYTYGFLDEPREAPSLRATRRRLIAKMAKAEPEYDWKRVIRRAEGVGYGLFLQNTNARQRLNDGACENKEPHVGLTMNWT